MIIIKILLSVFIVFCATNIGILISKKYVYRLQQLDEIRGLFDLIESKIKFTYEPICDIFSDIANVSSFEVRDMLNNIVFFIQKYDAKIGWEKGIDKTDMSITKEDKEILKGFGKMLGKTDKEGQLSQIYLTRSLIERQIKNAEESRDKNEKLYKKLGFIFGIGIVIVLV